MDPFNEWKKCKLIACGFKVNLFFLVMLLPLSIQAQENKFGIQVEAGYGVKLDKGDFNATQIYIEPRYHLNDHWSFGIGSSIFFNRRNNAIKEAKSLYNIPVYANMEYLFSGSGIKPFASIRAGYGLIYKEYETEDVSKIFPKGDNMIQVKNSGGYFLSPTVGIAYPIGRYSIRLLLSYDLQQMKTTLNDKADHTIENSYNNSTLSLKFGWGF